MIVSAIVAVGENGEIGHGGQLPWPRLRHDMRWFARCTKDKPIVMGRKTWDSLPRKPLPGRYNVVLSREGLWTSTRRERDRLDSIAVARSPEAALAEIAPCDEAVVIGGREIFDAFWDRLSRIYLTKVEHSCPAADTFFPYPLPTGEWREEPAHDRWFVDPASGIRMGFYTYERIV